MLDGFFLDFKAKMYSEVEEAEDLHKNVPIVTPATSTTVILWDVPVDEPPHNGGTHTQQSKFTHIFPMNKLLFNAFFVHSSQPFRWQRRADGSTGYHRLTEDSMLMKPGFLRSSQYVLLETHLSLWLVSTTFLQEKGHVLVFCPAYL